MRIAVDASCWQNKRGYGRHARALLSAMVRLDDRNHYTLFLDSNSDIESIPSGAEVRLVQSSAPASIAASSNGHRSARDMWRISRALSGPEFDVLLFPTAYSFVPVFSRARKIVIIHDVIAETYPQLTLPSRRARLFWNAKVAFARRQADAIVTVSQYSRRGILDRFKIDPARVFVVGEASDAIFRRIDRPQPTELLDSLGIDGSGRSVVYVGGFSPHKNLEALVAAFAKLAGRGQFSDVRLVMVGDYQNEVFHSNFVTIRGLVDDLGIRDRVVFAGYLPDEDLVALLNLSTVSVLPSLIEGFGLPAVEAAACGCPVIATKQSPLPELLGDGGLFIDPARPEEIETALVHVLESAELRGRMRESGLTAAGRLSWESSARDMIEVIDRVVTQ